MDKSTETQEKTYWKCSKCSYILEIDAPPNECPSCHAKCEFVNVTCYTPDCGLKGIDPKLA
jgi:rubrerythrin